MRLQPMPKQGSLTPLSVCNLDGHNNLACCFSYQQLHFENQGAKNRVKPYTLRTDSRSISQAKCSGIQCIRHSVPGPY